MTNQKKINEEDPKIFKHFFESSQDILCIANTNGYFDLVNPYFKNLLGYTAKELTSIPFLDLIHPDDVTATINEVEKLKMGVNTISFINRYRNKSGDYIWLEWNAFPDVTTGKLYANARDITSRKEVEEDLVFIKNRLELATKAGGVGIWTWDIVNNTLHWDDQMYNLYGITNETFSGAYEAWQGSLHPEDVERGNDEIQAAISGKKEFDTEFRVIWPDASIHFIRGIAHIIRDENGNALQMIGTNWDVTDSKKAEETIKKSLNEVSQLKNNLENQSKAISRSNALLEMDIKGFILSANVNFFKLFGYKLNEIKGKHHSILLKKEDVNSKEYIELWKQLQTGEFHNGEFERKTKNGQLIWIEGSYSPVADTDGRYVKVLKMVSDITERKKMEEQLIEINKELESFSYSVSHDLRAPLRAVNGYANMLLDDYGVQLDEEAVRMIKNIMNYGSKMGRLIDDLLDFSRLGRKEIIMNNLNMTKIVTEVRDELMTLKPNENIEFKIQELLPAFGDSATIKQVWHNLISNAIKYSSKKEKAIIEIGSSINGTYNHYYIKDNGAGFDMQYIDKLFGVFQRLHSNEEFEGTGIGLALVQRIIHKHGGNVRAEGAVGKGATFNFTLRNN